MNIHFYSVITSYKGTLLYVAQLLHCIAVASRSRVSRQPQATLFCKAINSIDPTCIGCDGDSLPVMKRSSTHIQKNVIVLCCSTCRRSSN